MTYESYKDLFEGSTFLEVDSENRPTEKSIRWCVLILLWEMASADGEVSPEEFHEIVRTMDHEFKIMDFEVGEMLETAKYFKAKHEEFEKIFMQLNSSFDSKQRKHLYDMIVRIVEADGKFDQCERVFMDYVRVKLNVSGE